MNNIIKVGDRVKDCEFAKNRNIIGEVIQIENTNGKYWQSCYGKPHYGHYDLFKIKLDNGIITYWWNSTTFEKIN
jgi:histidinol phosphatase-like enzyme